MNKKTKESVYKILWLVTGALFGLLVGALIELLFLKLGGAPTIWFGLVYLATIGGGFVFGRWAGPVAWKKIYIDGVRGKKYVK